MAKEVPPRSDINRLEGIIEARRYHKAGLSRFQTAVFVSFWMLNGIDLFSWRGSGGVSGAVRTAASFHSGKVEAEQDQDSDYLHDGCSRLSVEGLLPFTLEQHQCYSISRKAVVR